MPIVKVDVMKWKCFLFDFAKRIHWTPADFHHKWLAMLNIAIFFSVIDPSHKSQNASVPYPTMHHFVTEMCTCVHISVTKWCIVGYLFDALWDLWDGCIVMNSSFVKSGGCFNINMLYYQYRDSSYKDTMVSQLSYLYNGNLYSWKDTLNIETGHCII